MPEPIEKAAWIRLENGRVHAAVDLPLLLHGQRSS